MKISGLSAHAARPPALARLVRALQCVCGGMRRLGACLLRLLVHSCTPGLRVVAIYVSVQYCECLWTERFGCSLCCKCCEPGFAQHLSLRDNKCGGHARRRRISSASQAAHSVQVTRWLRISHQRKPQCRGLAAALRRTISLPAHLTVTGLYFLCLAAAYALMRSAGSSFSQL